MMTTTMMMMKKLHKADVTTVNSTKFQKFSDMGNHRVNRFPNWRQV